ncbi:MAG: nucleotidyltransferase domain-containing protein [Saprospiraceae bacterium]
MKAADFAAHGLSERDMRTITGILRKYPDVRQVCLFGSRAKGTFHAGSDIDLAIMNTGVLESTIRRLQSDFEESSLPWFVDIVDFTSLTHEELKDHIRRVGVMVYEREESV